MCTLVALWLLALMAGLSDFVPVIGFVVSSIPAIWLRERLPNETASRHAELERGE